MDPQQTQHHHALIGLRDAAEAAADSVRAGHHPDMAAVFRELAEAIDQAPSTTETPAGHRDFMGCRRWVRDEARKRMAIAKEYANTGSHHEKFTIAKTYEEIAKAMGDYWLGPEDSC